MRLRKAVIPAAGLGTRLLPITKALPKEMLPLIDVPIIQLVVEEAVSAGITDILIITGKQKNAIEDHFDYSGELMRVLEKTNPEMYERLRKISLLANIHYIRQHQPRGLGDALLYAESHVDDEPFAVLLGDTVVRAKVPCLRALAETFEEQHVPVMGAEIVSKEETHRYGIVDAEPLQKDLWLAKGMIEKPSAENAPSNIALNARYILTPDIFRLLKSSKNTRNELQLTGALNAQCKESRVLVRTNVGVRYDIGSHLSYLKAIIDFALVRGDMRDTAIEYMKVALEDVKSQN